jgi:hypothetical protein
LAQTTASVGQRVVALWKEIRMSDQTTREPSLASCPLLSSLGRRLPLVLVVLLFLGMAWGWIGVSFGAPDVIWHEDNVWFQMEAGLAAALLLGQIAFVAYLLDSDQDWLKERPEPQGPVRGRLARLARAITIWVVPDPSRAADRPNWSRLRWYLAATWLPLLGLLIVPVFVHFSKRWPDRFDPTLLTPEREFGAAYLGQGRRPVFGLSADWCLVVGLAERWPLLLGVVFAAGVVRLSVSAFHWVQQPRGSRLLAALPRVEALPVEQRWQHGLAAYTFGVFFTGYALLFVLTKTPLESRIVWAVSPAVALCTLAAVLVGLIGFIRFHFRRWRVPVYAAVVAWIVLANWSPYKVRFPSLDYDQRVSLEQFAREYDDKVRQYEHIPRRERDASEIRKLEV